MAPKRKSKIPARYRQGRSILSWLVSMCKDPPEDVFEETPPVTVEDLLSDREIPWLPIDRGNGPDQALESMIHSGYVERRNPIPAFLKMHTGVMRCFEAIRLTRKGRDALAELEKTGQTDLRASLKLYIEMFGISPKDAASLHAILDKEIAAS